MPNLGCYLEVIPNQKLVWTDALHAGYRPSGTPFMTAMVLLEPEGDGTRYTAVAANSGTRKFFDNLSNSLQRYHVDNINAAKTDETRMRRIDKAVSLFRSGKKR